jgi:hypothetical protein
LRASGRGKASTEVPTVIELTCQSCGEKVGVQSLLTAAQQSCRRCNQLLMGPLARGTRTYHTGEGAESSPTEHRSGSTLGLWLGVIAGMAAGVAVAYGVSQAGSALPWSTRNAVLGALAGVLLSPVLAISSFLSMLILPFSLEGLLGDSVWSGMAKALHHRTIRPLILPFLIFVVMPMALCAYGGSRMKPTAPSLLVPAALGATLLGAILGGIFGSLLGRSRQST